MPREERTLVCSPATQEPLAPSYTRPCDHCGQAVWVSKRAAKTLAIVDRVLCLPCALPEMEADNKGTIAPAPHVEEDVGHPVKMASRKKVLKAMRAIVKDMPPPPKH